MSYPVLERVLGAAIRSMIHGRHVPHSYRAHVVGRGYVNDGSPVFDRADYRRQLARAATSEVENMGYATRYAEPGYTQPRKGVLLANWNIFPSTLDRVLARAGYAVEWSDEWTTCEDCNGAVRTVADSYYWAPAGADFGDEERRSDYADLYGFLCLDCACERAHGARATELENVAVDAER